MNGDASEISGLPSALRIWIESTSGAPIRQAERHFGGASREAWSIDLDGQAKDDHSRSLFLMRDKGTGGGSARDAAVLRALADTDVPVPGVVGFDPELGLLLLTRLSGRSDFPTVDREEEREPTIRDLMEKTARLHEIDIGTLDLPHLLRPKTAEDCARPALEQSRAACKALASAADPFFAAALDWLEAHLPDRVEGFALVHSDMGPGNFLFAQGRVTGIVDWEVAHFGDPMEDLAAVAVRDMATPVGPLAERFAEYARAGGGPVDLDRIEYYRLLILVRNSLMIGLGLAHPVEGFDVVEMTMYQTMLLRAATLVYCDVLGIARPTAKEAVGQATELDSNGSDPLRVAFLDGLARDFETLSGDRQDDTQAYRAASLSRGLAYLAHESRVGPALDRLDEAAIPDSRSTHVEAAAAAHAERIHRLAERRRPLMGELMDREPQRLRLAEELEGA